MDLNKLEIELAPQTSHFNRVFSAAGDREFGSVLIFFELLLTPKNFLVAKDASGKAKSPNSSDDFNTIFH